MQQVWDVTALAVASIIALLLRNPEVFMYGSVGLLVGIVLLIWVSKNIRSARRQFLLKRGKQMTRAERIAYRKMLVATILTDGLEKAEEEGRITRLEVQQLYKQVGHYLNNGELIPRRIHPESIRHSLLKKAYTAVKKQINIPGPKPGEELTLIPFPDYKTQSVSGRKKLGAAYSAHKQSAA